MRGGGSRSSGANLILSLLLSLQLLVQSPRGVGAWQFVTDGGAVYGRPTFSHDGRAVYVTSMSANTTRPAALWALRVADGAPLWPQPYRLGRCPYVWHNRVCGAHGAARLSPDGQTLYLVGEDYRAHAVSTESGRGVWQSPFLGAKLEGTPALDGTSLFVATGLNKANASASGVLRALDPATGAVQWSWRSQVNGSRGTPFWAAPALASLSDGRRVLLLGSKEGEMFAFDTRPGAEQRVLWRWALPQLPKPADAWGCVGAGIYGTPTQPCMR